MPHTWPRTVLITGATDGIGLALARFYQTTATRFILVGRRPLSSLDDPIFTPETYCQADLSQPDCGAQITQFLQSQEIKLEVLIHNAGVGYYGSTAEQSWESIETLLAVNLLAPLQLTQALFPYLTPTDKPAKVVFISSVVSAIACPDYAVYGASKAALDSLARSLRIEQAGQVAVQLIHPGATHTSMHQKSGLSRQVIDWAKFPPAETVARQIAFSILSDRTQVTLGFSNKLLRWVGYYGGSWLDAVQSRFTK